MFLSCRPNIPASSNRLLKEQIIKDKKESEEIRGRSMSPEMRSLKNHLVLDELDMEIPTVATYLSQAPAER